MRRTAVMALTALAVTFPGVVEASAPIPRAAILTTRTQDFCTPGWSRAHRHVTAAQRRYVRLRDHAQAGWVVDHRVSLEAGGSNATVNLLAQPPGQAKAKDVVEGSVHRAMCSHRLSVHAGQLRLWTWRP